MCLGCFILYIEWGVVPGREVLYTHGESRVRFCQVNSQTLEECAIIFHLKEYNYD